MKVVVRLEYHQHQLKALHDVNCMLHDIYTESRYPLAADLSLTKRYFVILLAPRYVPVGAVHG